MCCVSAVNIVTCNEEKRISVTCSLALINGTQAGTILSNTYPLGVTRLQCTPIAQYIVQCSPRNSNPLTTNFLLIQTVLKSQHSCNTKFRIFHFAYLEKTFCKDYGGILRNAVVCGG